VPARHTILNHPAVAVNDTSYAVRNQTRRFTRYTAESPAPEKFCPSLNSLPLRC